MGSIDGWNDGDGKGLDEVEQRCLPSSVIVEQALYRFCQPFDILLGIIIHPIGIDDVPGDVNVFPHRTFGDGKGQIPAALTIIIGLDP